MLLVNLHSIVTGGTGRGQRPNKKKNHHKNYTPHTITYAG